MIKLARVEFEDSATVEKLIKSGKEWLLTSRGLFQIRQYSTGRYYTVCVNPVKRFVRPGRYFSLDKNSVINLGFNK